jgi:hypothetical protein
MGEAKGDNTPLGRGLLDHLIELIKAHYPDDWVRFCHLARIIERDASEDEAARRRLRVYRRYDIAGFSSSLGREVSASNELRKKFVEHFADVYRDHPWTGRAQGTLETRRLEPRQIRAGALRFDPDELVLDKGKLVIVDVRIEPTPAKPEDGAIDAPAAAASVEEAPAEREPVILVLKRLFPPDGLRPKGRSVKWVTSSLNKLPEFKDHPVSEDTVYRAFKDMEAALEK